MPKTIGGGGGSSSSSPNRLPIRHCHRHGGYLPPVPTPPPEEEEGTTDLGGPSMSG